jgi:hypothetical protein
VIAQKNGIALSLSKRCVCFTLGGWILEPPPPMETRALTLHDLNFLLICALPFSVDRMHLTTLRTSPSFLMWYVMFFSILLYYYFHLLEYMFHIACWVVDSKFSVWVGCGVCVWWYVTSQTHKFSAHCLIFLCFHLYFWGFFFSFHLKKKLLVIDMLKLKSGR